MRTHRLKTEPEPFQRIWDLRKKCELRRNDRGYKLGDELTLQEWVPPGADYNEEMSPEENQARYTGREIDVLVTDIVSNRREWGLMDGFVIMSYVVLTKREKSGLWGPRTSMRR